MRTSPYFRVGVIFLLGLGVGLVEPAAAADEPKSAELHVEGLGWWHNREMKLALERLLNTEDDRALNENALEDAAFLLVSMLTQEGFLSPVITIRLKTVDGADQTYTINADLDVSFPRNLRAKEVNFDIERGKRSFVENVAIEGLQAIPLDSGELFFRPGTGLIAPKSERPYSGSRMRRASERLKEELRQKGYAQAEVEVEEPDEKPAGGPVNVVVRVEQGPLWRVSGLRHEGADPASVGMVALEARWAGQPWSSVLQQNLGEEIRQAYYQLGYADVRVGVRADPGVTTGADRNVVVVTKVEPGEVVRIGNVRFSGNKTTEETLMRRRVNADPGDPLNPVILERARYRLSRLGVFDSVGLRYEPTEGEVRDPVYLLRESRRIRASLLAGYGSYEQLRGGVEVRQTNLFGRAHHSRLSLIQSMKSTRGEYTYSVPEFLGESIDGTARVFGLEREEIAFMRQEYGVTVTLKRPVAWLRADGSVGYTFQSLKNRENELTTRTADDTQVTVGSIDLGLTKDRRDSPLRPTKGYRWFAQMEAAHEAFGGEVNYERIELGGAYHTTWGRSRWIHAGLTHGVLTTLGATSKPVPVNKRFFPGGDSSIRGYQEGEAAPRGEDGLFVGAKTYLLLNLELEQSIIGSWTAVVFFDALGLAARLADYPMSEQLYSAGLGVRYQTLIGPIRLEYGRNLNPRPEDPSGTLHLSVGFPF